MTNDYKLPRCWLGMQQTRDGKPHTITAEEVNLDCTCTVPMQAFMCAEGHLTECHKGMSCEDAECSHLPRYQDDADGAVEDGCA
jgi:hypothetical protein